MKSKTEFIDKFADQLTGFLLSAFVQDERNDQTMKARFMTRRISETRPLLEEMYRFVMEEAPPKPKEPPLDELVSATLAQYTLANDEVKKRVVEKFRVAFTPAKPPEAKK